MYSRMVMMLEQYLSDVVENFFSWSCLKSNWSSSVLAAYQFQLIMNHHQSPVEISLGYWLIEASFFPYVIVAAICTSYFQPPVEYLLEFDLKDHEEFAYLSKMILFVVMRCTELYPSSAIAKERIPFFVFFCIKPLLQDEYVDQSHG